MTGSTRPRPRAVIAGAGIAGLATALQLHRIGWEVHLVERAKGRRREGYLMNLAGHGYDSAERLGVLPELTASDIGLFTSILTRADGRQKFTVPSAIAEAAAGDRTLSVFRGDVEAALYEAVRDHVGIRFATTISDVEQTDAHVNVTLSDGSAEQAALVVGADGLHSGLREIVFGPATNYQVDTNHLVAALPLDRIPVEVPAGTGATFIGPRRTAAVINSGPGRSSAFFAYHRAQPETDLARGPVRALTAVFGDLGGAIPDVLRQLASSPDTVYFDVANQVVIDRWSRGRVVLVGDAAWCVTVFAGYGAGLALTGATRLGNALTEHADDVPGALAAWEASLRAEVIKRQALARRGMQQFCPPSRAHVWGNDLLMRAIQIPGIRSVMTRSIRRAT